MAAELHRTTITQALDPDLPMRPLRRNAAVSVHVGLWSAWWTGEHDRPAGIKVVVATVHHRLDPPPPSEAGSTLGTLPWVVLQLQALTPKEEKPWEEMTRALESDLRAYDREQRSDARCPGRLVYDPSQEEHSLRRVRNAAELEAYAVERDRGTGTGGADANTVAPATVATRTRVPYRVSRGGSVNPEAQPLLVFVERPTPNAKVIGNADSGLMPHGTLLAAIGEWRTWIVLTDQ